MVDRAILLLLITLMSISLFAEVDIDATLSGLLSLEQVGDSSTTSSGLASGSLTVKSTGSNYVKSQLTLNFQSYRSYGNMTIDKAWIKFRYPLLRVTLGKNRITWGEGAVFNAGDVIFDDYINPLTDAGDEVDLTADELKSLNRTMGLVTFPLGRFSFFEMIYLPYDFLSELDLTAVAMRQEPEAKNLDQNSYGGRYVTRLGGVKLEGGYIFNGDSYKHKPYLSIEGTLGVDYHLSSSAYIDGSNKEFDDWRISGGIFYLFELEDDKTLTLRLETMVKPDNSSEQFQLYPEISYIPNEEWALFLRSIINPLDIVTESTFGLNWKTYPGFTIGSFFTLSWDDEWSENLSIVITHKF